VGPLSGDVWRFTCSRRQPWNQHSIISSAHLSVLPCRPSFLNHLLRHVNITTGIVTDTRGSRSGAVGSKRLSARRRTGFCIIIDKTAGVTLDSAGTFAVVVLYLMRVGQIRLTMRSGKEWLLWQFAHAVDADAVTPAGQVMRKRRVAQRCYVLGTTQATGSQLQLGLPHYSLVPSHSPTALQVDFSNHVLRRINLSSGLVTTLAATSLREADLRTPRATRTVQELPRR